MAASITAPTTGFISPFLLPRHRLVVRQSRRMAKIATPRAKLQIEILTIGKRSGKDAIYDPLISEYKKRMSRVLAVSERAIKPARAFDNISEIAKRGRELVFLLDEHGDLPRDSVHFSKMMFGALEQGGSRLAIVIGDAEGLQQEIVQLEGPRVRLLSLSPLTFTHNMVRLFLYEQLYRAAEIRANSKYHK